MPPKIGSTAPPSSTKCRCATTKYVSLTCQSIGKVARKIPEIPPITNTEIPPTQNSSGVLYSTVPRHSVAIQLRIFTPVGTAIKKELTSTNTRIASGTGAVNMWCAHVRKPRNAIATVDAAIAR